MGLWGEKAGVLLTQKCFSGGARCLRCVVGDISNPVKCIEDVDVNMVANFCEVFAQVCNLEVSCLSRW